MISDLQIVRAYADFEVSRKLGGIPAWPLELLHSRTGEPRKACYRELMRAASKGLVQYGVSVTTGWLTPSGFDLLRQHSND